MLKRLLFGNEAKLQFKTSSTDGIARLYTQGDIPAQEIRYWQTYLQIFDSANDVFSLLSIADVRKTLIRHPENIATLIRHLVNHLDGLKSDPEFCPKPSLQDHHNSTSESSFARFGEQAGIGALSLVDASAKGAAAFTTSLFGTAKSDGSSSSVVYQRDRIKEALNCCRILTRLIPILLEGDHDASCNHQADGMSAALETSAFEEQLLWSDEQPQSLSLFADPIPTRSISETESQENQFVIEASSEEEDERDVEQGSSNNIEGNKLSAPQMQVGETLTRVAIDMLFYSGFTIPWTEEQLSLPQSTSVASSRIHYAIWEKGIGSSVDLQGRTKLHESHRLEFLRLLLVLLSKSIYVPPNMQSSVENRPLSILTRKLDRGVALPLLCSLINVSIVSAKSANWLSGLSSLSTDFVKDRISGSGTEDPRQATVTICLQILNILLCREGTTTSDEAPIASTVTSAASTPRPSMTKAMSSLSIDSQRSKSGQASGNLFRLYLSKLHRAADFHLLADGLFAILSQRPSPASLINASSGLQPTDTSGAGPHIPEAFLLLWRLLWHNVKFRAFTLENRSPELLANLLFHALNNKDSLARQGLVRLAVFILHDISSERAFAVGISKSGSGVKARITGSQRWGIALGGGASSGSVATAADILVQAVYALIASTKTSLAALYSPMIITVTNVSPYFKNLSVLSSNRLLALFTSFSDPAFLLADEGNPRVLFYLLEALNNIVVHGFQRNANVAYAIVRNHVAIEKLANFTLRRGIAEVRRSRKRSGLIDSVLSSPMQETPPPGDHVQGANPPLVMNETDPVASEKARGKMRRSSTSDDVEARQRFPGTAETEEDALVNGFNDEELYMAASLLGKNGFVPTQTWVTSWHKGLPLDVLQITVVELVPKVHELCASIGTKSDADERIVAWLREQDLQTVLPKNANADDVDAVPVPRPFRWTSQVSVWMLSYLWGLIYITNSLPFGLFNGSCARLFQLKTYDGHVSSQQRIVSPPQTPERQRASATTTTTSVPSSPYQVGSAVFGNISSIFGVGGGSANDSQRANANVRGGIV